MVIAIFTDTYPPFINGVSTSCYNLAKTLREHGHRAIVVTPRSNSGKLEIKDDIIYMPGLALKKLYGFRVTSIFDKKVYAFLKENKVDVIHYHSDATIGIFARRCAKHLRVPLIYTYHTSYEDYTYYITHGFFDRVAKRMVRTYTKNIGQLATEFVTPSIKTKDFLRNVGHDIYINVIPTGIDFSIFSEDKFDKEKAAKFKEEHGIDDDTKVVLLLGRVAKEKSMDISINYFAQYAKSHPKEKLKMIVVGDGPMRSELELLTHELGISGIVDFIGFVSANEVPFFYHLADVYNSASITETQGLTFMEAMAASCVVLARFDDNLTDTIVDGQTGFFFTDEASYISKLETIFKLNKEEKEKLLHQAFNIIDEYSMEKFYERIVEVYRRAVRKFW